MNRTVQQIGVSFDRERLIDTVKSTAVFAAAMIAVTFFLRGAVEVELGHVVGIVIFAVVRYWRWPEFASPNGAIHNGGPRNLRRPKHRDTL